MASTTDDTSADQPTAERIARGGFDRLLSVQRPVVLAHLRQVRARHPNATTAEVVRILERRYLTAITAGGAGVGAIAAMPAVGTGIALVISGVETVGFLETSALFAQSVAELHGIAVEDPERASALVMALLLGTSGGELVQQLAGQATGGPSRVKFWGELITKRLPKAAISTLTDGVRHAFVKRFAVGQSANIVLRIAPFGVGAVIGAAGNRILAGRVVKAAREAFGTAPEAFPAAVRVDAFWTAGAAGIEPPGRD